MIARDDASGKPAKAETGRNPLPDLSEFTVHRVDYYGEVIDWDTGNIVREKLAIPRRTRVG